MKTANFEAVMERLDAENTFRAIKEIAKINEKLVERTYKDVFDVKLQAATDKHLGSQSKKPQLILHIDAIVGYNIPKEELPMITRALKRYIKKIITPCPDGKHDWLVMPSSPPILSVLPRGTFTLHCTKCDYRRIINWTSLGFIKYVFKPYRDNPSRLSEEMRNYLESLMNQYGRGILSDAVSEIDKKIKRLAKKYPKTKGKIKKLEKLKSFCYIQANLYP